MTTYGVTPNGFVIKPFAQIESEITAELQGIEPTAVITPQSTFGQFVTTAASREYALWELLQILHSNRNVYNAKDLALDDLLALNGIKRYQARYSYIYRERIVGKPGTVIPAGFVIVSSVDPTIKFQTLVNYTIGPNINGYPPYNYGEVIAEVSTITKGFVVAPTGTITVIEKNIFGVEFCLNEIDAVPGRDRETDTEALERREQNMVISQAATLGGIRTALVKLNLDEAKAPLTYVNVISNRTSVTDVRGRPPHSVECVVEQGGLSNTRDQEIAQAIFDAAGCGTAIYGTLPNFNVQDYKGNNHLVSFTRPILVPISMTVQLLVSSALTAGEVTTLKNNLVVSGSKLKIGEDVAAIGVNGLGNTITNVKIKSANLLFSRAEPTYSIYVNIEDGVLGVPEHATFDADNIDVTQVVVS